MGLAVILLAIVLFLLLGLFTMMVSPPSAWVNRDKKKDKDRDLPG